MYIVKIHNEKRNCYRGLDDILVIPCANKNVALKIFENEERRALEYFEKKGVSEEELNYYTLHLPNESTFSFDDGEDYINGNLEDIEVLNYPVKKGKYCTEELVKVKYSEEEGTPKYHLDTFEESYEDYVEAMENLDNFDL